MPIEPQEPTVEMISDTASNASSGFFSSMLDTLEALASLEKIIRDPITQSFFARRTVQTAVARGDLSAFAHALNPVIVKADSIVTGNSNTGKALGMTQKICTALQEAVDRNDGLGIHQVVLFDTKLSPRWRRNRVSGFRY